MRSRRSRPANARNARGLTLVEVLAALALASLLMVALGSVTGAALALYDDVRHRNALTREARFAMERMVQAVRRSDRLLLPRAENTGTAQSEAIREPGVLVVTLDPMFDRDGDGFADADNDQDGQVNEDWPWDQTDDLSPGIEGIDDDHDGLVDEAVPGADDWYDNDEDGQVSEDPINGIDDDGDGAIDEDPPQDSNGDGQGGRAGVDDDGDGSIDEGYGDDDDEDGAGSEDWLDVFLFYLSGAELVERMPNLNPVDGNDYAERVIAEDVTRFRVERLPQGSGRVAVVDLLLELGSSDVTVSVQTRLRVGGGR